MLCPPQLFFPIYLFISAILHPDRSFLPSSPPVLPSHLFPPIHSSSISLQRSENIYSNPPRDISQTWHTMLLPLVLRLDEPTQGKEKGSKNRPKSQRQLLLLLLGVPQED